MNKAIVYLLVFVLAFGIVAGEDEFGDCPDGPDCNKLDWAMDDPDNLQEVRDEYPEVYQRAVRLETGLNIEGTENIQNIRLQNDGTLQIGSDAEGLDIEGYPEVNGPAEVGEGGTLRMKDGGSITPGQADLSNVQHANPDAPSLGDVSGAQKIKATKTGWVIKKGENTQEVKAGQKGASNIELSTDENGNLQVNGMSFKGDFNEPITVNGPNSVEIGDTRFLVPKDANAVISPVSGGADYSVSIGGKSVAIKGADDVTITKGRQQADLLLNGMHAFTYREEAKTSKLKHVEPVKEGDKLGLSYMNNNDKAIKVLGEKGIASRLTWDVNDKSWGPRVLGENVDELTFKTGSKQEGTFKSTLEAGAGVGYGLSYNSKGKIDGSVRSLEKGGVSWTITDEEGNTLVDGKNPKARKSVDELQDEKDSMEQVGDILGKLPPGNPDAEVNPYKANYLADKLGDRKVPLEGDKSYKLHYNEEADEYQVRQYEGEWIGDDVKDNREPLDVSNLNPRQAEKLKNYYKGIANELEDVDGMQDRPRALNSQYGISSNNAKAAGNAREKLLGDLNKQLSSLEAEQKALQERAQKRNDEGTHTTVSSFDGQEFTTYAGGSGERGTFTPENPNKGITYSASGDKTKISAGDSTNFEARDAKAARTLQDVEGELNAIMFNNNDQVLDATVGTGGDLSVGDESVDVGGKAQNFKVGGCVDVTDRNCIGVGTVKINDKDFSGKTVTGGREKLYANGVLAQEIPSGEENKYGISYFPGGMNIVEDGGDTTASKTETYTVNKGDKISQIAADKEGVSTEDILRANGLTYDEAKKIQPGEQLTIPREEVDKSLEYSVEQDKYTIQKGDTLSEIAAEENVPVKAIVEANDNIDDKNVIQTGDKINIPNEKMRNVEVEETNYDKELQKLRGLYEMGKLQEGGGSDSLNPGINSDQEYTQLLAQVETNELTEDDLQLREQYTAVESLKNSDKSDEIKATLKKPYNDETAKEKLKEKGLSQVEAEIMVSQRDYLTGRSSGLPEEKASIIRERISGLDKPSQQQELEPGDVLIPGTDTSKTKKELTSMLEDAKDDTGDSGYTEEQLNHVKAAIQDDKQLEEREWKILDEISNSESQKIKYQDPETGIIVTGKRGQTITTSNNMVEIPEEPKEEQFWVVSGDEDSETD